MVLGGLAPRFEAIAAAMSKETNAKGKPIKINPRSVYRILAENSPALA